MITSCNCPKNAAGIPSHTQDCPYRVSSNQIPVYGTLGWICPRCGRGNSPFTGTCICLPPPPPIVTC